ncbi:hypothetical protein ACFQGT_19610 [Natrialbaceae archaeon GCM10025810]|uniref:EMC6-like membrane protein n=1 Tax=Halovalidus salilacus TaxID=3075124 RepID=UPI00362303AC
MATESMTDRREHLRSVGVTAFSSLLGVGAGLASAAFVGLETAAAGDSLALAIVLGAIVIQLPILRVGGVYDEEEFGFKHYVFISLMTFAFWFITWGILLNTGATA